MKEQIINIRYIDKGKLVAILRGRFPAPNEFQISVSPESLAQLRTSPPVSTASEA
ncbi:hypothetical protein ASPSYDRAFT_44335 [Aspergillus sydowii CBS 593.65]|uniref:Uncharacterized protein n=1 Tax=Aspergillus sydowii CBS 593.65 TaxID=1036612 RepID=A0A1L9TKW5_9EURO|nr:uncharacterized protein ASPSYDRAFT_44335 [Aspergillus sydowii CBS 593.65]OJJ59933.1 hypothetical protein ASPSYDRAFT_44335 [Aspergillus sydowii CBS 593.65]